MGGGVVAARVPRRHLVPDHGHGFLHDIGQLLPSYWLVQAATSGSAATAGARGLDLIAVWTVALTAGAVFAYRRDTGRV